MHLYEWFNKAPNDFDCGKIWFSRRAEMADEKDARQTENFETLLIFIRSQMFCCCCSLLYFLVSIVQVLLVIFDTPSKQYFKTWIWLIWLPSENIFGKAISELSYCCWYFIATFFIKKKINFFISMFCNFPLAERKMKQQLYAKNVPAGGRSCFSKLDLIEPPLLRAS